MAAGPLILTLPYPIATRYASMFGLAVGPAPVVLELPAVSMTWSTSTDGDPSLEWLRRQVLSTVKQRGLQSPERATSGPQQEYLSERMTRPLLTPAEHALLREVRISDEDHGGLDGEELATDEYEAMERLSVPARAGRGPRSSGEAPDGEEDEREIGESVVVYRITGLGVAALSEAD